MTLDTLLGERISGAPQGVLEIDIALVRLAAAEPRLAKVVEMRFFGGFSEEEVAAAMEVSARTIRRDWDKARRMLLAMLA